MRGRLCREPFGSWVGGVVALGVERQLAVGEGQRVTQGLDDFPANLAIRHDAEPREVEIGERAEPVLHRLADAGFLADGQLQAKLSGFRHLVLQLHIPPKLCLARSSSNSRWNSR